MKKNLAIVLAAVLVLSVASAVFAAAPTAPKTDSDPSLTATITMVPEYVSEELLTLRFELECPADPESGKIVLNYDTEFLSSPVAAAPEGSNMILVGNPNVPGVLELAFASTTPFEDGELFTVSFVPTEACIAGATMAFEIDVEDSEMVDSDNTTLLFISVAPVSYTIPGASTPEPTPEPTPTPGPGTEYETGDVNMDGLVNTGDAALTLRFAVGLLTLTDEQLVLANMNGDDAVNTGDAAAILRFAVGL